MENLWENLLRPQLFLLAVQQMWVALILFLIVVAIASIGGHKSNALNASHKSTVESSLDRSLVILTRQAARWAVAAQQDSNALIGVLHANYAAGYLWAIKDIANGEQVRAATGLDLAEFERHIVGVQDNASRALTSQCPALVANVDLYLAAVAGDL